MKITRAVALVCLNKNAEAAAYCTKELEQSNDKNQRSAFEKMMGMNKSQLYEAYKNQKW
jgi:hypothetical protein